MNITQSNDEIQNATGVTASSISDTIDLNDSNGYAVVSIITETTASALGTVNIDISVDGVNWVTAFTSSISGTGNHGFNIHHINYNYARVNVIITSGTVSVVSNVCVKIEI